MAFQKLKAVLTTVSVLMLPNFSKTFIVDCDASSDGVGAIFLLDEHLVVYCSKGFSFYNKHKSAYDWEILAVLLALQKWRHYLSSRHFFV